MSLGQHTGIALATAPLILVQVIIDRWPDFLVPEGASHEMLTSRSLILHDLLSLLVGYVGAWIVWFFATRSQPDERGRREAKA